LNAGTDITSRFFVREEKMTRAQLSEKILDIKR